MWARQSAEADIQIDMHVFFRISVSCYLYIHFGAQSGIQITIAFLYGQRHFKRYPIGLITVLAFANLTI